MLLLVAVDSAVVAADCTDCMEEVDLLVHQVEQTSRNLAVHHHPQAEMDKLGSLVALPFGSSVNVK